jgi:hypothetical protein
MQDDKFRGIAAPDAKMFAEEGEARVEPGPVRIHGFSNSSTPST